MLEIDTATAWARFVVGFPRAAGGMLYPDWPAVAAEADAVHLSLHAVVAAQSLILETPAGLIAPSYWDVESTFWLSWAFIDLHPADRRASRT